MSLQKLIDDIPSNETLTLRCGEYEGPIVIQHPIVLDANGGTIWSRQGPVLTVASDGIVLRNLHSEVTALSKEGDPLLRVALNVQNASHITYENVSVKGSVLGLEGESGDWQYPHSLDIPFVPRRVNTYKIKLYVPVPCQISTKMSGITITPQALKPGLNEVQLIIRDITAPDTVLYGSFEIRSAYLIRIMQISGSPSETPFPENYLIWEPPKEIFKPPIAPSDLTARPMSQTQIDLFWKSIPDNRMGFKIERKSGVGGIYADIATVGPDVTTYSDTGLQPNTTYHYRIKAYNAAGDSGYSNEASDTTPIDLPVAPSDLKAKSVSQTQIDLTWKSIPDNKTGFKIERRSNAEGTFTEIDKVGTDVTTYSDTSLQANTTYHYRLKAFNAGGDSTYSNEVSATTLVDLPKAPSDLTAIPISQTRIDLSWKNIPDNNRLGFKIERKSGVGDAYAVIDDTVGADVTTYSDTDLQPNTTYHYRIKAYNASGDSGYSNEATDTTLSEVKPLPTERRIVRTDKVLSDLFTKQQEKQNGSTEYEAETVASNESRRRKTEAGIDIFGISDKKTSEASNSTDIESSTSTSIDSAKSIQEKTIFEKLSQPQESSSPDTEEKESKTNPTKNAGLQQSYVPFGPREKESEPNHTQNTERKNSKNQWEEKKRIKPSIPISKLFLKNTENNEADKNEK